MGNTPREREKRVDDDEAMMTMVGDNSGPAMGGDRRRGGAGWRWLGFQVRGDHGAWSALGLPLRPLYGRLGPRPDDPSLKPIRVRSHVPTQTPPHFPNLGGGSLSSTRTPPSL
jgi:hypothetical protein